LTTQPLNTRPPGLDADGTALIGVPKLDDHFQHIRQPNQDQLNGVAEQNDGTR